MDKICQQFSESAAYLREWIQKQPGVKEESLTDWLLYDISKNLSSVYYHAFTRHEEGRRTGADWEWWFLLDHYYLRLHVQAKKLLAEKDNYLEIQRSNDYGWQINKLRDDSKRVNAIPLYAFFTAIDTHSACAENDHVNGVFIAGGEDVYSTFMEGVRKPVPSEGLLLMSNPLSCFVCCPLTQRLGPAGFIARHYASELEPARENEPRGVHHQLPNYVSALVDTSVQAPPPDWWEQEFHPDIEDFQALLICDFRRQQG